MGVTVMSPEVLKWDRGVACNETVCARAASKITGGQNEEYSIKTKFEEGIITDSTRTKGECSRSGEGANNPLVVLTKLATFQRWKGWSHVCSFHTP